MDVFHAEIMQAGRALKHKGSKLLYLRKGTGDWVCTELLLPTWEKIPKWMIPWWFQVCVWEQCGKLIQLGGGCVFIADHQLGLEQGPCSARAWAEPLFPLENPKLWGSCGITGGEGIWEPQGQPWSLPWSLPCKPQCRWPCPCWGVHAPSRPFQGSSSLCWSHGPCSAPLSFAARASVQ